MTEPRAEIVVGVLGQWASGKTTAATMLIDHLGGEGQVEFINDRVLLASQVLDHILELEDSQVVRSVAENGTQRLVGQHATVYLPPGEELETVNPHALLFDLPDDPQEDGLPVRCSWFNRARVEIGQLIHQRSAEGKPIVIEAGFGTNAEPQGENPFSHTIADLFAALEKGGVDPKEVKWIIVEAGYELRSERNRKRPDSVPAVEFDRFAADGGDLDPDHQKRLEEQGIVIERVPNEHDDIGRFRADVIGAFEEMFGSG